MTDTAPGKRGKTSAERSDGHGPRVVQLYLLRHGPAGLRSAWRGEDSRRPLTDNGAKKVKRIASRLAAQGVVPELIVTSPFERAAKTARIVADALGLRQIILVEPTLAPGFGLSELVKLLGVHRDAASVMLVGHEPDFSEVTRVAR